MQPETDLSHDQRCPIPARRPDAPAHGNAATGTPRERRSRLPLERSASGRLSGTDWTRWLREQTRQ